MPSWTQTPRAGACWLAIETVVVDMRKRRLTSRERTLTSVATISIDIFTNRFLVDFVLQLDTLSLKCLIRCDTREGQPIVQTVMHVRKTTVPAYHACIARASHCSWRLQRPESRQSLSIVRTGATSAHATFGESNHGDFVPKAIPRARKSRWRSAALSPPSYKESKSSGLRIWLFTGGSRPRSSSISCPWAALSLS